MRLVRCTVVLAVASLLLSGCAATRDLLSRRSGDSYSDYKPSTDLRAPSSEYDVDPPGQRKREQIAKEPPGLFRQ